MNEAKRFRYQLTGSLLLIAGSILWAAHTISAADLSLINLRRTVFTMEGSYKDYYNSSLFYAIRFTRVALMLMGLIYLARSLKGNNPEPEADS